MLLLSKCCRSSRSPSVLVTLLRLRNEFQRLGGNAATVTRLSTPATQTAKPLSVGPKATDWASSPSEAFQLIPDALTTPHPSLISSSSSSSSLRPNHVDLQRLVSDAQRLLTKGSRTHDPLSDVTMTSPQYYMEVGKLLTAAALFRAATTDARVAEGLAWVRQHLEQFQTPRQIISLCVPILHLKDGPTKGQQFIWDYLYEPLLESLQRQGYRSGCSSLGVESVGDCSRTELQEEVEEGRRQQQQQHRTAVVSVFSLISKWLPAPSENPLPLAKPAPEEGEEVDLAKVDKLLTLLEAAVGDLRREFTASSLPSSSSASLRLAECAHYLQGSHAVRQQLRALGAAAAPLLPRLDACDRAMGPLLAVSIATAVGNNLSAAAGPCPLRPYDVINVLKGLVQLDDGVLLREKQSLRELFVRLPVVVSMSAMSEICALVQVLGKIRGRDASSPARAVLSPSLVLPLLESIRAKLFLTVESHSAQLRPMECSLLLSGLSRLESSGGIDDAVDEGSRAPVENVYVAKDVLNLLCVHFIAGADQVGVPQLVPFLQGLARLKATRSRRHGRKAAAKGSVDVLSEHLSVWSTTLERCADIAMRLAKYDKLSVLEAANILALLVQLHFKGCESFFVSVEKLFSSILNDNLLSSSGSHRSIQSVVFDAVGQLIVFLRSSNVGLKSSSNTEHPASHTLGCALELRGRLYNSVLSSVAQAETPKDIIRLLKLLYPSLSTPTSARAEVDIHDPSSSTTTRVTEHVDHGEIKMLVDSEADDEAVVYTKDILKLGDEEAVRVGTDVDADLALLRQASRAQHTVDASLEVFAQQIGHVSKECNAYELVELSMALAQLYRCHGLRKASAHQALDRLLDRASSFSLTVTQYKKLLDALRIAKKGDKVPLHILVGFSGALAVATASSPRDQESRSAEGGSFAAGMTFSTAEAIAIGRTILASIKQQLKSLRSIAKGSSHAAEQQQSERRKFFLEIGISYTSQCAAVVNQLIFNTNPDHLSDNVEELIVLAYILAQLHRVIIAAYAQSGKPSHKSEVTDETVGGETPGYDDGDQQLELAEESGVMDDQDHAPDGDSTIDEDQLFIFRRSVADVFNALGDAFCSFLEESQFQSGEDDEGFESSLREEGCVGSLAAVSTSGESTIEPKKYVMLMQSFGIVGVVHRNLLYTLLPQIQRLAPCMDPLELSLLMNYLARSGVCSRRVLDCLATEIGRHVAKSELRQCYAILRSLQRSGFLNKGAFLWPKRALVLSADQSTDTLATSRNAKLKSSLDVLARAVVERLDSLVLRFPQIRDAVHSYSLNDLVGVLHVLEFFDDPPQPTFDSCYIIATKKLLVEAMQFSGKSKARLKSQIANRSEVVDRMLHSAVLLASHIHLLRRSDHQAVSSRVIAYALGALCHHHYLGPRKMLSAKHVNKRSSRLRAGCKTTASVSKLSNEKLLEFLHAIRFHWMLYGVKLFPSEFIIMDLLLKRLETLCCDERGGGQRSDLPSTVYSMVDQLTRWNVAIPFKGKSLQCAWRLARFADHCLLRHLSRTPSSANGTRLTQRGTIALLCVQNYLACGSPQQRGSRKQRGPDDEEVSLSDLLLPGLRKTLSDSITSLKPSCGDGFQEEGPLDADLEAMRVRDIASLYLTQAILLSRVDASEDERSVDLKGEVAFFICVASTLISKLELQDSKINMRSCVDVILGSCLFLNIESPAESMHFEEIQSSDSHAVNIIVREVLVKASQALSSKLQQNSHSKGRWILSEIYRLILGFECVLVRVALAPPCPSPTEVASEVGELSSLAFSSYAHPHEEVSVFESRAVDHTVNAQEECENLLYRALMTIALAARATDGTLLRLGKHFEAHLVSKVRACLNTIAIGQGRDSTANSSGAQRIAQVVQWIAEVKGDRH